MSSYVTLTLNENTFRAVMDLLEESVVLKHNYPEIEDVVHLVDILYEEYENYRRERNSEWIKYREQEELFEQKDIKKIPYFHKVKKILEEYEIELIDSKHEFHFIMDIIDAVRCEDDN